MRSTLCGLLLILSLASCKKVIEKAQEQAAIDAITNGYWTVTKYIKGTEDVTNNFSTYKFQFKETNTVDAYKNNVFEKTGAWEGNVDKRTISANFTNVAAPLLLLNGTWTIKNSTWTSVEATQTINGEACQLRLDKQQ